MKSIRRQQLDTRDALQVVEQILQRIPGFTPAWRPRERGADAALMQIFARYFETILQRLNQTPEKTKLAFFDQLGIDLVSAQAARAPIVFQLPETASDGRVPTRTRVVAPPPPESTRQIIFETERAAGLASARLVQVVSLWPGRDQYIDHSAAHENGEQFQLFTKTHLRDTPHILYLAHNILLNIAGQSILEVEFELSQISGEHLDILWEYWDGEVWRGFKDMQPLCAETEAQKLDGTQGLTRSGRYRLETDCAETAKTAVNGNEAFWIRGRLTEPLLSDLGVAFPEVERLRLSSAIERPIIKEEEGGRIIAVTSGLLPDMAFANATKLDLTKPFYPYGNQPQPGDTYYFSSDEIFSKPGARVEIVSLRSVSAQDNISLPGRPASIALETDKDLVLADGSDRANIIVTVLDFKGSPVEDGTEVSLSSSLDGSFFETTSQTVDTFTVNGSAQAPLRSRVGGLAEIIAVSGGISSERLTIRFRDRFINLTLSSSTQVADIGDPVTITANVTDLDAGSVPDDTQVVFRIVGGWGLLYETASLEGPGSTELVQGTVGGTAQAFIQSNTPGDGVIEVQSGVIVERRVLVVWPPIELEADPPRVAPGGSSEITARVINATGEPIAPGNTVNFGPANSVLFGTWENGEDRITNLIEADGLARATVTGPEPTSDQPGTGTANIKVTFGPTFGRINVRFADPTEPMPIALEKTTPPQPLAAKMQAIAAPGQQVVQQTSAVIRLSAEVQWEYWNGIKWAPIPGIPDKVVTLDNNETNISFLVPFDMARTTVNDQEGYWIRVRLNKGGFGVIQRTVFEDQAGNENRFEFFLAKPPVLADFRLGYSWQYGPFLPERVVTYNDFQYEDQTEAANLPGRSFQPYKPVSDVTPTLFLGFSRQLPVDRLNIFFDILEKRGETQGPALQWEYWNGDLWRKLAVEDETNNLRVPGMLSFIAAADSQPLARFGQMLHWLRVRLKEDGPPGEPTINRIFHNAVWASQRETVTDEPLGISTGQPNQIFNFRLFPVLQDERLEVRELAGARANVEWRIIASELFDGDTRIIRDLEEQLGGEGLPMDIEMDDLRLRRDPNKRVVEVWVRWQNRPHLFLSGARDRHYVLQRASGRLVFGNGEQGKIPPPTAQILARRFRTGGGRIGNVAANTISQLQGAVGEVEAVFNPIPAEGGADGETLELLSARGPLSLRHRGKALLPADFQVMAKEASPAVAVARAVATRDPSGRRRPGWITLIIIPQSDEPRPWPSFGLRVHVRKFIEARAAANLAAAHHIYVTGPDYFAVEVQVIIVPDDPAAAGEVEQRTRQALETFFHPLRGGAQGQGWELGRDVFLSDVAAVLERVAGVDFVKELTLSLNGVPQGERVSVPQDHIVVAGDIRISIIGS